MATNDPIKKFAEQALQVERVLGEHGLSGNAARVLYILDAARRLEGVTQKQVVDGTYLPKDVVSKLVRSLVGAGLRGSSGWL